MRSGSKWPMIGPRPCAYACVYVDSVFTRQNYDISRSTTRTNLLVFLVLMLMLMSTHPRRPRGSQSGREKRRDESFQVSAEEPLGTDSHRTISKNSSWYRLLIGHKKCFVLLCPIANSCSWVLFVSSYTTAIVSPYLPGSFTKLVRTRETFY